MGYPAWGEALGFMISLSSMLWVPGYAIYYFFTTRGTWQEVLRLGVTPVIKARPEALLAEIKYNAARAGELKDVELSLLDPPAPKAVPGTEELFSVEVEEEEEYVLCRGGGGGRPTCLLCRISSLLFTKCQYP